MKKITFKIDRQTRNELAHIGNRGTYFEYVAAKALNGERNGKPYQTDVEKDGLKIECKHFTIIKSNDWNKTDKYNCCNFPKIDFNKSIEQNVIDYTQKFNILAVYFGDIMTDETAEIYLIDNKSEQIEFLMERIYWHTNKLELMPLNPDKKISEKRIQNRLEKIKKVYAQH